MVPGLAMVRQAREGGQDFCGARSVASEYRVRTSYNIVEQRLVEPSSGRISRASATPRERGGEFLYRHAARSPRASLAETRLCIESARSAHVMSATRRIRAAETYRPHAPALPTSSPPPRQSPTPVASKHGDETVCCDDSTMSLLARPPGTECLQEQTIDARYDSGSDPNPRWVRRAVVSRDGAELRVPPSPPTKSFRALCGWRSYSARGWFPRARRSCAPMRRPK